jgi:hypothetical protein
MRLVSALLSERRVILVSSSVTRLATCCRSALSVPPGSLHWQHLLIPVLTNRIWDNTFKLHSPTLIGILKLSSVEISKINEIGEVLLINLDRNEPETSQQIQAI